MKKRTGFFGVALLLAVLVLMPVSSMAKGPVDAVEVQVGAKNSGAPSQQLAGRMGLFIESFNETIGKSSFGTVNEPQKLIAAGFTGIKAGDKFVLIKTGELTYKLRIPTKNQEKIFKVVFSK